MTFLIRCITHTDPGIMSVPIVAKTYQEAREIFCKMFNRWGYTIVDISIIDYEEW